MENCYEIKKLDYILIRYLLHGIDMSNTNTAKCLIVDDNKLYRSKLNELLSTIGYHCHEADNGKSAVEKTKLFNYDFILMDVHMPNMNGIEASRLIREFNSDVIIIGITATSLPENIQICLEAGFNDVLIKPINEDMLDKIINTYRLNSALIMR